MTWLDNGATINMCPDDLPVALINVLATDLGVDPGKFYEHVKRYVDREVKRAAAEVQKGTTDDDRGGAASADGGPTGDDDPADTEGGGGGPADGDAAAAEVTTT